MSHPRRIRRAVFTLIPLAALACGFEPLGDRPVEAPAFYRGWWRETEACSGRSGDFDRVQWFTVPGHSFTCASGECAGHWEPGHRIYIAADFRENELVVRHEMLHELLGRSGHPDPPFGIGCPLTWTSWVGDRAATPAFAAGDTAQID